MRWPTHRPRRQGRTWRVCRRWWPIRRPREQKPLEEVPDSSAPQASRGTSTQEVTGPATAATSGTIGADDSKADPITDTKPMSNSESHQPRPPAAQAGNQSEDSSEEEMIPDKQFCTRGHRHAATQCDPSTEEKASLARPWMCDKGTQTHGTEVSDCTIPPGLTLTRVTTRPSERPIDEVLRQPSGMKEGGEARGAVRRSQTLGPCRAPPQPGLNAAARLHLGKAKQILSELLPSNPGAHLTEFQQQGHYKYRHDLYHKAQMGEAIDIQGQLIESPLFTDNVGRWIWSLVGALLTHDKLGAIQSWQTGGDLVESWLHSLWSTQAQAELDVLANVSRLASHLHDGLQNLPRALYLQLQWKTHWPEFFQALSPYLYRPDCIDGPPEASRLCNAPESMSSEQYMPGAIALLGPGNMPVNYKGHILHRHVQNHLQVNHGAQVLASSTPHLRQEDGAMANNEWKAQTPLLPSLGHALGLHPNTSCPCLPRFITYQHSSVPHRSTHGTPGLLRTKREIDAAGIQTTPTQSALRVEAAKIRLEMPKSPRRHPRARARPNGERRRTRNELARRREQRDQRDGVGPRHQGSRTSGTHPRRANGGTPEEAREPDPPTGWP